MGVLVAATLDEAVAALGAHPDALVLAGGTDLMVEINEAHRRSPGTRPCVAVEPGARAAGVVAWTPRRAIVRLGAGVTYAELERPPLADLLPALGQAARTVGSPQIRNAATIGGNLAPARRPATACRCWPPSTRRSSCSGRTGRASMPVGEFMTGVKRTARRPGELITAVTVPLLDGWQGYAKVGVRNAMVIAIAGACLAVDGPSRSVRLALGSVAPTIVRAPEAEAFADADVDWDARRRHRRRRRPLRRARGRRGPPDRRPPRHRRLPPPGRRGARRPPAATGVPGGAS